MAYDVHLHVCFACSRDDGVAALAKQHLAGVGECKEAAWFLEDLAQRTGANPGPKGGLSLWGIVGNYTRGDEFVEALKPFWLALLSEAAGDDGPCSFEHILVFEEAEQSERAIAYEIMMDDEDSSREVVVRRHECPFAWMQY